MTITRAAFLEDYIGGFNAKDFERFGRFYADGVRLSLSGKRVITGRTAILDFYRDVARVCDEKLAVIRLVLDAEGVAVEIDTEFKALANVPDFIAGPLVPGQSIFISSVVFYEIRDGQFSDIVARRVTDARAGPSSF